jgi:hypothetical protein
MEIGLVNGSRDWSYSGALLTLSSSGNFSSKLQSYLASCGNDGDDFCEAPVYVYSGGGVLNVTGININFTNDINPVPLNASLLSSYLAANATSGTVDIPVALASSTPGVVKIDDVTIRYVGGNQTYNILSHNDLYTQNSTFNLTVFHSRWNFSLPRNVLGFEFVPSSPRAKNVSPYGQSATTPILNITNLAYGEKWFNFSVFVNESYSCVNLTFANSSNVSTAVQSNGTWSDIVLGSQYLNSAGIWVFANYDCNYSAWRYWQPNISLRACAFNASCDTGR